MLRVLVRNSLVLNKHLNDSRVWIKTTLPVSPQHHLLNEMWKLHCCSRVSQQVVRAHWTPIRGMLTGQHPRAPTHAGCQSVMKINQTLILVNSVLHRNSWHCSGNTHGPTPLEARNLKSLFSGLALALIVIFVLCVYNLYCASTIHVIQSNWLWLASILFLNSVINFLK